MKKPVIGITLDFSEKTEDGSYASRPWYAARCDYSDAITKAGGTALFLPYSSNVDDLLCVIDGLLISGGDNDINPSFYGQEIISDKVKINDPRAGFEINLFKEALRRNVPVFGICNGLQVINVALGGSLIQHIPDSCPSNINHEQPKPKDIPTHSIIIENDTLLSQLSESVNVQVNTTHHQSIDKLGKGLIVSATAPDGIIEAIELPNHKFVIGVQWHSEYENSNLDTRLFARFVEESLNLV